MNWDNPFVFFGVFIAALVLLIAAVSAVVVTADYYVSRHGCNVEAHAMGRDARYTFWNGCFVRLDNGQYVAKDKLRFLPDGQFQVGGD